ncbi:hypothetical protein MKW94_008879 [Papaver nudicaule]|uniref:SWIM-type domain-containing protein n=1 Tax=Papaver nudicaule TaxID=74823 RepID=A0AA41S2U0_PAPNU|nr:hypothetical protein [Papaver nudicaule]
MHTRKSESSNFSTHTKTILNFPKYEKLVNANSEPEPLAIIHPAENLSEEEDVVLQEFGQCGIILDYDTSGNWMHILYRNQDVLVGVKPVDSFVISDLNGRNKICSMGSDDRINKALCGKMRIHSRSKCVFFVLAETCNVYNVTVSTSPSSRCNCPDNIVRCKHILFVFLRVLGVSQEDCRIWRKSLLPCELTKLHNIPTPVHTLAGARVRHEFERLLSTSEVKVGPSEISRMKMCSTSTVECESCMDVGHKRFMTIWRKRKAGKINVCACCSEEWISAEHNSYTNLRDYMD